MTFTVGHPLSMTGGRDVAHRESSIIMMVGPTAAGKTELAIARPSAVADHLRHSRQIYAA
jgi:hypothetical protein